MKLIYELSPLNQQALDALLGDETVWMSLPCDVSLEGKKGDGHVVFTHTRVITLWEGTSKQYALDGLASLAGRAMIGNAILESETPDGALTLIARFSLRYAPQYMQAARTVTRELQQKPPPPIPVFRESLCPKCGWHLPQGSSVCRQCNSNAKTLVRLLMLTKPYWLLMLAFVVLSLVQNLLQMIPPSIEGAAVDKYFNVEGVVPGFFTGLGLMALAMVGIGIVNALAHIAANRFQQRMTNRMVHDLRVRVFTKLQQLSLRYQHERPIGDMINRVQHDTEELRSFLGGSLPYFFARISFLVIIVIRIVTFSPMLTLLVILPFPIVIYLFRLVARSNARRFRFQWRLSDRANRILQDILSGIRVVKSYRREAHEVNRYSDAVQAYVTRQEVNEKFWISTYPFIWFIMGLSNFVIIYYFGVRVLNQQFTVGAMVTYTAYATMLQEGIQFFVQFPRQLTHSMTCAERVFEVLDEQPDIASPISPSTQKLSGAVTYSGVTFGYDAYDPVLHDIDLQVQPGEMVGLVGASGSGKSTLCNLLLRLYDAQEGSVSIGGVDIRDYDLTELRNNIGVVLQENFLFSGTILENIRYARPEAGLEEVIRAAKLANAHDFITQFADGYDTYVGENGYSLSGGERQRVAIARAVLHNPRILILDEATASLDTQTERHIQDALQRLTRGRTVFAIAHRLSTLKNADRLIVLDKGRIAETGTHTELLRQKGIYYKLVMMQRTLHKIKS